MNIANNKFPKGKKGDADAFVCYRGKLAGSKRWERAGSRNFK